MMELKSRKENENDPNKQESFQDKIDCLAAEKKWALEEDMKRVREVGFAKLLRFRCSAMPVGNARF